MGGKGSTVSWVVRQLSRAELASKIDHSGLKPFLSQGDVVRLCQEAMAFGCATVCVNPVHVPTAVEALRGSRVGVCSVVGFPFGASPSRVKALEAELVVTEGAVEVDMVLNVGAMKGGDVRRVREDIRTVVEAAAGRPVKVILETAYLTDEEKRLACELAAEAGAAYVKTSTGFAPGGATLHDVKLMASLAGKLGLKVKAAGGIRWYEDALAMIEAGADRLGTSATAQILAGASG